MSTKVETENSTLDVVKIAAAILLVLGSLVAYYLYPEVSRLARVIGVVLAVGMASGLFLLSEQGKVLASYLRDAQVEVRKVVWPTRQETLQTTLMVVVVVALAAFLLWALDWILGAIVQTVIG